MSDADRFLIEFQKREELPPTSESVKRERTRKIFAQRSPRIVVSYNRQQNSKIGSLSPDLLKKLNAKHHFEQDDRALTPNKKRAHIKVHPTSQGSNQVTQEEPEPPA